LGALQELELQARYMSALEVLAPPQPPSHQLDAPGSPSAAAAASLSAAAFAASLAGGSEGGGGSLVDTFDARLRQIVAERLGRAEAAQVIWGLAATNYGARRRGAVEGAFGLEALGPERVPGSCGFWGCGCMPPAAPAAIPFSTHHMPGVGGACPGAAR
jgi:hypothetical protein